MCRRENNPIEEKEKQLQPLALCLPATLPTPPQLPASLSSQHGLCLGETFTMTAAIVLCKASRLPAWWHLPPGPTKQTPLLTPPDGRQHHLLVGRKIAAEKPGLLPPPRAYGEGWSLPHPPCRYQNLHAGLGLWRRALAASL